MAYYIGNDGKYEFKLLVAGVKIRVLCNFIETVNYCKCYYSVLPDCDLTIDISLDELNTLESFQMVPTYLRNDIKNIISYNHKVDAFEKQTSERMTYPVAISTSLKLIEPFMLYEKIVNALIPYGIFLMHGSVVSSDNEAYMFTAPSGVGKTTRTKLWLDLYTSSIVINGDKPLIKITETQAIACGTPWCGKEGWNTNTMVPLKAIFLLERTGDGETSSIEEVSLGKAFPFLLQQIYRPKDFDLIKTTVSLLKSLEGKLQIYKFRSTPTEESVRLAYETARTWKPNK